MVQQKEIEGGASHGRGTLIVHRWRRYEHGRGTLSSTSGYLSVCGRIESKSIQDLGPDAKRCKSCFKRPNTPS